MKKEKSITSTALETGGKLYPARGYTSNLLPKEGIKITPPKIAKSIIDGESKIFVKPVSPNCADIEGKKLVLLSLDKALGVIEFGKSFMIEPKAFSDYIDEHLITEEMCKEWGEVQPSWNYGPWVAWNIESIEKFDEPLTCQYDKSSFEIIVNKIWFTEYNKEENVINDQVEEIEREIEITSNLDLETLSTDELVNIHFNLHKSYQKNNNLTSEEIMNLHSLVVDELYIRDESHPIPPDNGLDKESYNFEVYSSKQNKWFELEKAVWSTAYINRLPDSAFLYVESGGKKDEEGKTVPRTLRHFPYKDINDKVDLPHLRNAIARIPQSKVGLSADQLESLQNKARKILEEENKKREKVEKKSLAAFLVEAGPPIEWSGRVASALGKKRCDDLEKLWDSLSDKDKKAVEEAFDKMFDATDIIFDIEDKYGDIAKSLVVINKDLYISPPSEDTTYRYVVQNHFNGKSLHSDIRMSYEPGKRLIGWTLNTQIPESVKDPVVTLDQVEQLAKNLSNISKIDWNNNHWGKTEILSKKKSQMPWEWINVEGKIDKLESGSTMEYSEIIDIVAKGTFEYGAQKTDFHEYFFNGSGLNSRIIFKQLNVNKSESSICSGCGKEEEEIYEVAWSGNSEKSQICEKCFTEFVKEQGGFESVIQKAEEGEMWLAIRPEDKTPYVISDRAVDEGWMPQSGYSALPIEIREQIPEEFRYWNNTDGAKTIRNELVKSIKNNEVDIDFDSPYEKLSDVSKENATFVFHKQLFDGKTKNTIRIDVGNESLTVFDLSEMPIDKNVINTTIYRDKHKDSMSLDGKTGYMHYINKNINSSSEISILDTGKATIVLDTDELIEIIFKGNILNGIYKIEKNADNWQFSKSGDFNNFNLSIEKHALQKSEDGKELRLVTGIVLEPNEVDAHNDYEKEDTIRKTAHKFLSNYNKDTKMGLMHSEFDNIGIELVESYISPIKMTLNKKNIKKGSWIMTVHVSSDSVWSKVKSGELTGFSIGGIAMVEGR